MLFTLASIIWEEEEQKIKDSLGEKTQINAMLIHTLLI